MKILRSAKALYLFISLLVATILICSCQKHNSIAVVPIAHFTYTGVDSFPVTVHFTNMSTNPVGTTSVFFWNFGDGTSAATTNATHVYTQAGTYNVSLVQLPSSGAMDTVVMALVISPSATGPTGFSDRLHSNLTASFIYAITRPYYFTFQNVSLNASAYTWNFGDGATLSSDSASVKHTYATGGSYNVSLVASSSEGTDSCRAIISF